MELSIRHCNNVQRANDLTNIIKKRVRCASKINRMIPDVINKRYHAAYSTLIGVATVELNEDITPEEEIQLVEFLDWCFFNKWNDYGIMRF